MTELLEERVVLPCASSPLSPLPTAAEGGVDYVQNAPLLLLPLPPGNRGSEQIEGERELATASSLLGYVVLKGAEHNKSE